MRPYQALRRSSSESNRNTRILRDGGAVQPSGHVQAVEALHPADGFGQHLGGGLHGGHLPAGLGQVAVVTQPHLRKKETGQTVKEFKRKAKPELCPGMKEQIRVERTLTNTADFPSLIEGSWQSGESADSAT